MIQGRIASALTFLLLLSVSLTGCSNIQNTEGVGAYIVVLDDGEVASAALKLSSENEESNLEAATVWVMSALSRSYDLPLARRSFTHVIRGGLFDLTMDQVLSLNNDPRVKYVERDKRVQVVPLPSLLNGIGERALQGSAPWGLDRVDQVALPLDRSYRSHDGGAIVNAYVIDTGIAIRHVDFQGRASHGFDFIDNDQDANDCNGHGTHVAGSIAGGIHGVSKTAKLIGVRVLDCQGSGSISGVVAGIEWVTRNHVKPAVANMSLGGGLSQAIDDAILASVQAGVTYVVAAGNENQNACNSSPARAPLAITVGSTTNQDARSSFSNFGSCVDIFAPGSDILSTWHTSTTATNTISGTSMASPHVAGVAALYLAAHPQALPAEVSAKIITGASTSKVSNAGSGSPNLLLNSLFALNGGGENPPPPPPVDPDAEVIRLQNGVAVTGVSGVAGSERFYIVEIPSGAKNLSIEISGGSGDADLYTKQGARPSQTLYECRPYQSGNGETCSVALPQVGKFYVRLHAYSAFSAVQIRARYEVGGGAGNGAPCESCVRSTGSLKEPGASINVPDEFQSAGGAINIWLRGPQSADFDLYLFKKESSGWVQVASSLKTASEEQISYQSTAGFYRVQVKSYSGSGAFELWRK